MSELLTPQSSFGHRLAVAWQLFWAALRPHRFVRAEVLTPEEAEDLDDLAALEEAQAFNQAHAEEGAADARAFTAQLKQERGWS